MATIFTVTVSMSPPGWRELADPGGVCISSVVNESVGNRIDVTFKDRGEVAVKNIVRPIRVWKWHPDNDPVLDQPIAKRPTAAALEPEAPSIAVLPFNNMSGDPEQEYFSDGITEDIITDLSKIAGLLVIARNSSFAYKGKSTDIRTVGRELGVRSVLEGSIRRAGNRVRITAQLINAANGGHLWAERYDRDLTDIFAVQDEVTRISSTHSRCSSQPAKQPTSPTPRPRASMLTISSSVRASCYSAAKRIGTCSIRSSRFLHEPSNWIRTMQSRMLLLAWHTV